MVPVPPTSFCTVLIIASNALACARAELGVLFAGVVTGQDDIGSPRRNASGWEIGRYRPRVDGNIESRGRRRKRTRLLDECLVVLQPFAVVERDRTDNSSPSAVRRGEPSLFDRALSKDDLVPEGGHANRLDVDAELARPVGRHHEMGTALGFGAHHVMRSHLRTANGVAPEFRGEKLVLIQDVGRTRDVPGDEDVVGHEAVDIEGAAAGVTGDTPEAGRKPGTLQPFNVADGS